MPTTTRPIPADLEKIVRPQTADDLARRLGAVRGAEEWTPLRAREWWDQHRPASPAGAAETVMAQAGAGESG
jgi:hypothetical protein